MRFTAGDYVRLKEPYRTERLRNNPRDFAANAESMKVIKADSSYTMLLEDGGINGAWVLHAFELAEPPGGPW